jgi:hypothetical protein
LVLGLRPVNPEDEDIMLSQNVRIQVPTDTTSYPKRMESFIEHHLWQHFSDFFLSIEVILFNPFFIKIISEMWLAII